MSFPECEDLNMGVGLAASTNYRAIITNHFGQKYFQDVTSDGSGSIVINIDSFPSGFFNPYSGFFKLEATDSNGYVQQMAIAYGGYSCVSFDIYSLQDAN
jgi:hypothetical protein